jgi:hypothetical protein
MNRKDDFDIFLEHELKKSNQLRCDDEFKQKVLESLPVQINRHRTRYLIIYISVVLSFLLFFLIIDLNIISDSIIELCNFITGTSVPSLETIIVVSMFCFILYLIPRVEFKTGLS